MLVAFFAIFSHLSYPGERAFESWSKRERENVQNGPRLASGKPERLTLKSTPVPLALLVPETEPRTPLLGLLGRVAVYVTPAGFFWTTAASPSAPVAAEASARVEAKVRRVEECIL